MRLFEFCQQSQVYDVFLEMSVTKSTKLQAQRGGRGCGHRCEGHHLPLGEIAKIPSGSH